MSADELSFSLAALQFLIGGYSHEPGVRLLDDGIDALCRRAARLRAEGLPVPGEMGPEAVSGWLRAPRFQIPRPGVALGLAVTAEGGDVLLVEAACLPGRWTLHVTRTVGSMTRESANVAMTWVRSYVDRLASAGRFDDSTDVHAPGRGRPVEGRSRRWGSRWPSPWGDTAMTGELTLAARGRTGRRLGGTGVLLDDEADVRAQDAGGDTPLHRAASGDAAAAADLLDRGADISACVRPPCMSRR